MVDDTTGGTDTAAASPSEAASNSGSAADSLPLSVPAPSSRDDAKDKSAAEQKARDIFRKLAKDATGDETVENDADAEELDDADTDDDATTTKAEKTPAEAKPAKSPDAPTPAALNDAREALVRDGWTLADLEKLPAERLLELGGRRKQQQQAQDRFGSTKAQELAQLKARLAELEPTNNPQPAGAANPASPSNNNPDPAFAAIKEKLSKLGDVASPEAQAAIQDALEHVYRSASSSANAQVQAQLAQITQATETQLVKAARAALVDDFPDLKDDAKFGKVMEKAKGFAKSGLYGVGDMEALVRDAAATLYQPTIKDVQRKMLERTKRAKEGQPDVGQQTAPKEKPKLTGAEKSKEILKLMQQGKSPEAARRKVMSSA